MKSAYAWKAQTIGHLHFSKAYVIIRIRTIALLGKDGNNMTKKEQSGLYAGIYTRLSDDDENDGTSISIETQIKILTEYCKVHGFCVYDIYSDDGYTGTNFNRPGFLRMMEDIRAKRVNLVIVKDLSRFGRNYLQVGTYISEVFPAMNVRFIAVGDDVDTAKGNVDYDLMFPIKNIFNEYYPADCSRKTKQALLAKAMNGEFIGSFAKYGLKKSAADKHILEINDETGPIVRWIFEMTAYQGYGLTKTSLVLKENKILTPAAYQAKQRGIPYDKDPYDWNPTTILNILNDLAYLGYYVSGKRRKPSFKSKRIVRMNEEDWIVIPGVIPALITQQLWDDAHAQMDSRKRTGTSGFENIFAGLIKCDKCGYALGIANSSSRDNYYLCNRYKKKGPSVCSSHYILYRELYAAVLRDVNEVLQYVRDDRETFVQMVLRKVDADSDHAESRMEDEIRVLEAKIEELGCRYDRLYDDRCNGIISDRKFRELSTKCEAEQDAAQEQLMILRKRLNDTKCSENGADHFIQLAEQYGVLTELDSDVLHRLIQSIIIGDRVKVDGENRQAITVNYRFIGNVA